MPPLLPLHTRPITASPEGAHAPLLSLPLLRFAAHRRVPPHYLPTCVSHVRVARTHAQVLRVYDLFYDGKPWSEEELLKIFTDDVPAAPTTCCSKLKTMNRQVMDLLSC